MPQFTPKPPLYEARQFVGGDDNALDIQGWLQTQDVNSKRVINDVPEGEEQTESIRFGTQTINSGQWLMLKDGAFVVLEATDLYTLYSQQ